MDTGTARMLARYRAWADKVTFDAVAALPPGEAEKPRQTLFKTMIGTLNHNLLIDKIWQAHLLGRDHGFAARNVMLHADLASLWQAQQEMNQWWIDWVDVQSPASLDEVVPFTFIGGEASSMTRGDMLLHVVTHGSYHRGWVAEMFFAVPAHHPAADLPVYLREMARR